MKDVRGIDREILETGEISRETFNMVQNNQESRWKQWATHCSLRWFTCTSHSFVCWALLVSFAHSAALIHSLAHILLNLWKGGFCPCKERIDFMKFQPIVHRVKSGDNWLVDQKIQTGKKVTDQGWKIGDSSSRILLGRNVHTPGCLCVCVVVYVFECVSVCWCVPVCGCMSVWACDCVWSCGL